MQIIEYELKRGELWTEDLKDKNGGVDNREQEKKVRKFQSSLRKQEQPLRGNIRFVYIMPTGT